VRASLATATLLLAITLCACRASDSSSSAKRYANKEQGYSVAEPESWTPALVRGYAQFSSSNADARRHTIVVRASDKPKELVEGKPTTREDVLVATEKVLRALPGVELQPARPLGGAKLAGARYSLTFTPSNAQGRYRRDQATLVGRKHVYRVIYTAPADEPIDEAAFQQMISTLGEEG
jgi:hypothetical protein